MSLVCAGLLAVGWAALITKIVKTTDPAKKKATELLIALLQLLSVVTSGIARFYFTQLTTRSGLIYATPYYPSILSQY